MQRFTQLFTEMDRTKRTSEKLAALERYFHEVPADDAAWALFFLSGRKLKRLASTRLLAELIEAQTNLPDWLIGESYEAVGDFAEEIALLLPERAGANIGAMSMPLHQFVQERMLALRSLLEPQQQRELIARSWNELDFAQRLVFNKLITGNFRVGVAQTLIIRALAAVANVTPAVMTHRFTGNWEPTAESFTRLLQDGGDGADSAQPYPYFLGYPMDIELQSLGRIDGWQIEWKYDGLRAQLIRRSSGSGNGQPSQNATEAHTYIWSRGDELITPAFPEIAQSAADLPAGTVLDGEIVAWENDHPLPFTLLQRRINRKQVDATLWTDVPVAYVAFDVLEHNGIDLRPRPLSERRATLAKLLGDLPKPSAILPAPIVRADSWEDLAIQRERSRSIFVEGVMLKRLSGSYGVGRRRGDWWKWKINPYSVDAILIYAQGGSGRRSGLFTDYTFGVWDVAPDGNAARPAQLVPVAKAYSGLTDEEIREVDRFIRRNTVERHGPVRVVKPELVFELAFQGVQESNRHKAQLALRFPRMARWRQDKKPQEADTLETLRAILRSAGTAQS